METFLALVLSCLGNTVLDVDPYHIQLDANHNYYIKGVEGAFHEADPFVNGASAQGIVFSADGEWQGSGHGNETVVSVSLEVDEQPQPLDGTYTGTRAVVEKHSDYNGYADVYWKLVLTPFAVYESCTVVAKHDNTSWGVLYLWLSTHENVLSSYWSVGADGVPVEGTTAADDAAFTYLPDGTTEVTQYDATRGCGLTTLFFNQPDGEAFIWDRATDNKLYYRVPPPSTAGEAVNAEVVRFYQPDSQATCQSWFASCMEEYDDACVAFDADRDNDVDLRDYAALQAMTYD